MVYICGGMIRGAFALAASGFAAVMGTLKSSGEPLESLQAPLSTEQILSISSASTSISNVEEECDCTRLWLCLADGDKDCSGLNAALEACLERKGRKTDADSRMPY